MKIDKKKMRKMKINKKTINLIIKMKKTNFKLTLLMKMRKHKSLRFLKSQNNQKLKKIKRKQLIKKMFQLLWKNQKLLRKILN